MAANLEKRTQAFFNIINIKHGDLYDLSLVKYVNDATLIQVGCPIHGSFEIFPRSFKKGAHCQKCGNNNRGTSNATFKTIKELENKLREIHKNRYKYQISSPKVNKQIKYCCPVHGWKETQAFVHLTSGCRDCYYESERSLNYTNDEFKDLLIPIHGAKYDYTQMEYNGIKNPIKIGCKAHGFFYQTADCHKNAGHGCPECNSSKGENKIIQFLNKHDYTFIFQKSFDDLKSVKKLRYDFYLPELNTLIEYDGIQHFEKVNFSGNFTNEQMIENLLNIEQLDLKKNNYAKSNQIKLLRIKYTDIEIVDVILNSFFLNQI